MKLSEAPRSHGSLAHGIALVCGFAALAFASRDALSLSLLGASPDVVESLLFDTAATLPIVHVGLFVLVVVRRRKTLLAPSSTNRGAIPGSLVAIAGLAVLAWARVSGEIDLELDALILMLAGGALALGGLARLERALLPLALLALGRPLPPMLLHHLHDAMQGFVARFVEIALLPFGELHRIGYLLEWNGRLFEVIEGCSGLQLELILLTATLVYADFVSKRRRQTLGVVGLSLVLGPLLNGVRVLAIVLDPDATVSESHSTQGLLVIAAGVILIAVLDVVGERFLWPPKPTQATEDATPPEQPLTRRLPNGLVMAIAPLAVVTSLAVPLTPPASMDRGVWAIHEVRPELGRWRRTATHEVDKQYLGGVRFGNRLDWSYARDDGRGRARIFVAADDRRRRDRSAFSSKTLRPGARWQVLESERTASVPGPAQSGVRSLMTNGRDRMLSLHYRVGVDSLAVESLRWWAALDQRRSVVPDEMLVVRIDVFVDAENESRALAHLTELASEVGAALERARPHR